MVDAELHDRIEKYLLGELSLPESARLEAEMAIDPVLFEQVEIQRLGLLGLQQLAAADLREKFARWDKELNANPTPSIPSTAPQTKTSSWVWVSVVLFLLLTAGVFLYFQQSKRIRELGKQKKQEVAHRDSIIENLQTEIQQKQVELSVLIEKSEESNDSLMNLEIRTLRKELDRMGSALHQHQYGTKSTNQKIALAFTPSPKKIDINGIRGNDNLDPKILSAYEAFNAGSYSVAVNLFKNISPNDDSGQRRVLYYLPYALYHDGKFGEAASAFAELKKVEKYDFEEVEWYLLLCYVAEGRDNHTQKVLADILKNPDHQFYREAIKLKSKLEGK